MNRPEYLPDDQRKHLGDPPWDHDDVLQAWEDAHNHDVRLKCIPEYGCIAVSNENEWFHHLLWKVASAHSVYVTFDKDDGFSPRLYVDLGDGLWEEIADAVDYDEMGQ